MALVGNITIGIGATTQGLRKGLNQASSMFKRFKDRYSKTLGSMKNIGSALGVGAAGLGGGVLLGLREINQEITEIGRSAERLNIRPELFDAITQISRQFGLDSEDFLDALEELQVKAQEALIEPNSGIAAAFERLGISAEEVTSPGKIQGFYNFADAVGQLGTETEKLQIVDEIMSDVGKRTLPLIREGSDELRVSIERLAESSQITEDAVARNRKLTEGMNVLNQEIRKLGLEYGPALAEVLGEVARMTAEAWEQMDLFGQSTGNANTNVSAMTETLWQLKDAATGSFLAVRTLGRLLTGGVANTAGVTFDPVLRALGQGDTADQLKGFGQIQFSQARRDAEVSREALTRSVNPLTQTERNDLRRQEEAQLEELRQMNQNMENNNLRPAYIPK